MCGGIARSSLGEVERREGAVDVRMGVFLSEGL